MIYGAYGYTGELVAREAVERGMAPVLAGRNPAKLETLAQALGCETRAFPLDEPDEVAKNLEDMHVVVHCAGPFVHTARPMAQACLRSATHYLDITGEIQVFEMMALMDKKAKEAGVMLMPGTGFDVVPTDCLAAHLKRELHSATKLVLAFQGVGNPSHGTTITMLENLGKGSVVRKGGKFVQGSEAHKERDVDFGEGPQSTVAIPWGDVSTAYHSTGIGDIEVYMAVSGGLRLFIRSTRYLKPLLNWGPGKRFLQSRVPEGGPNAEERAKGYSLLWGEVTDDAGNHAEARMRTPEGYTLTMLSALHITGKVLGGDAPPGFKTPSLAYGPDLALEIEGVSRG